jgi:hypothetical protein
MNQTLNLGPEYDQKMLQALFDALTAEGAQTIEQRSSADTGPQETGYWKLQLDRSTIEVNAETFLGIALSGPVEMVARLTQIIQNTILSAFPGKE